MKIQVTNCLNCPFIVEDVDFDSVGSEMCLSCNLIKFTELESLSKNKLRVFDYEKWTEMEYLEPLEKCPLKEINKIEIQYEKT